MLYELRWLIPQRIRLAMRRWVNRVQGHSESASRLGPKLYELSGGKVASGPFAGMNYLPAASGSELCPKLLGTYEMELWPAIHAAIENPYERVVDIGAAEGYYAVGLAMKISLSRVVAFESNERARSLLNDLGRRNGVSNRIEIRGECTVSELQSVLSSPARTLIVCDAEGAEVDLLDLANVPGLASADILVELHDGVRPGASRKIRARFKGRRIEEFTRRPRTIADFPDGVELDEKDILAATWENRSIRQNWFWITTPISS